jgi:large subunit ribosomal protein L21
MWDSLLGLGPTRPHGRYLAFRTIETIERAMFAVIADGGRQFRIQEGETFLIDYREGAEAGAAIQFEQVLLANGGGPSEIGLPAISGAIVEATVVRPKVNGPKLEIGKFRKRKNSRRHTGHRQHYTSVLVTAIKVPGLQMAEKAEKKSANTK